jgi:hypothetical protein
MLEKTRDFSVLLNNTYVALDLRGPKAKNQTGYLITNEDIVVYQTKAKISLHRGLAETSFNI